MRALAGTVAGVILDGEGQHPGRLRAAAVIVPLAAVAWVVAPLPLGDLAPGEWNLIIALAVAVLIVFLRASRRSGSAVTAPVQLLVAALGVAAVAWYAGAVAQAQVGVMLAAAAAGFLAWNWPAFRFPPGAALLLGIGAPVVALAAQMAVWGTASLTALAILVLVFFSDWIAGGIRLGSGTVATAMRPVLVLLVASMVVGAAALTSYLPSGTVPAP